MGREMLPLPSMWEYRGGKTLIVYERQVQRALPSPLRQRSGRDLGEREDSTRYLIIKSKKPLLEASNCGIHPWTYLGSWLRLPKA